MSREPQDVDLIKPEAKFEPTIVRENNDDKSIPNYKRHLLCDENGEYPAVLNDWEKEVMMVNTKSFVLTSSSSLGRIRGKWLPI